MKKIVSVIIGVFLLGGGAAHSAPLVAVNFSGTTYTSAASVNMNGFTAPSGVAYSETTTRNPAASYNTALPSAIFYGGVKTAAAGGISGYRVNNQSATFPNSDFLFAFAGGASFTTTDTISMLTVWNQASFLNGLSTSTISLDSSTALSASFLSGLSNTNATIRLVLEIGSAYYVSSVASSMAGTVVKTFSIDPTTLSWFNYDPLSDISVVGSSVTGLSLSGIQAVGFLGTGGIVAATTNSPRFQIGAFQITAVPEPSTVALVFGSGLILAGFFWKKRRTSLSVWRESIR